MKINILRADKRHVLDINRLIIGAKLTETSIKGPVKNWWVVRKNGRVIACASLDFFGEETAILANIVVEKEFRHQGIGSALIQYRINVAKRHGAKIIALATMYYLFNFYKRRGFRTCPRKQLPESVKDYWMFTVQRYKKCAVMVRNL